LCDEVEGSDFSEVVDNADCGDSTIDSIFSSLLKMLEYEKKMIESVMRISAINNLYDKLVILSILICA
jgi:hypothetical protein